MNFNPVKDNLIIRNTIFLGNTVWRDSITHEVKYIEIKFSRCNESMTYILLDVHSRLYLTNKTLFNKSQTKYFSSIEAAQLYIHDFTEIIFYNDFIKKTLSFIETDTHPLVRSGNYLMYSNNLKKKNYFGINWFLIYYRAKEKNNVSCTNYYTLDDLNYLGIKTNYSSYDVITEIKKDKYEIIIPDNKIGYTPSFNFIKRNYWIKDFENKINTDYDKAFSIVHSFFKCIVKNIHYSLDKSSKTFIIDFVKNEPESFIKINCEILKYINIKE